jgi:shikimate kinase
MNIVLIGYRGTGKSTVGALVAEKLGMTCVNMDSEIVKQAGLSIPEIVEAYGWEKFRDMESDVARALAGCDGLVMDTGGGVIERPENIIALKANAKIFWLKASVNVIVSRIEKDTQRPALTQGKTFTEEVVEVLEKRIPKYKNAADEHIDTDDLTPEQVADRIVAILTGGKQRFLL